MAATLPDGSLFADTDATEDVDEDDEDDGEMMFVEEDAVAGGIVLLWYGL